MKTASLEGSGFSVKGADGKDAQLAMQELWLTGQILPVGARLVVRHVFQSAEAQPTEVVYAFALPRDAALRRFRIEGEGFKVASDLQPLQEANRLYEKGIDRGHLAVLAKEYGDGLVNLAVGNLKPGEQATVFLEVLAGVEVQDDGFRFRFPFTLAPRYHPQARMIEVQPGVGEQELPEDLFGDLLLPPFRKDAAGLHRVGFDLLVHAPMGVVKLASPSHTLQMETRDGGWVRISPATEAEAPDRDLVLDVTAGDPRATVLSSQDAKGMVQFAAVVPSTVFGKRQTAARRVVFVLDRSGSMDGQPIEQAKKAVQACLGTLSPQDSFGIVAFDSNVEVLEQGMRRGDAENRKAAAAFLDQIEGRGGTELSAAIETGAKLLGEEKGDLFVVTDGQVAGTDPIIAKAKRLGVRIHVLGIGSAAQDRFLALLARETGGISRYLTANERVDTAAVDLFASAGSPVARKLSVTGKDIKGLAVEPDLPAAVFADSPLVLFGEAQGAGGGVLVLSWEEPASGSVEIKMATSDFPGFAETLFLLRGARLITDAAAYDVEGGESRAVERRSQKRFEKRLEELSRKYGLASRRMSLVAVVKRKGDVGGRVPKTQVVPVGMPQGTPFGAYFGAAPVAFLASPGRVRGVFAQLMCCDGPSAMVAEEDAIDAEEPPPRDEFLMRLAARLEPDGGMPGDSEERRLAHSVDALLRFAENGNTLEKGPFREHVRKLVAYIERSALVQALRALCKAARECECLIADIRRRSGPSYGAAALGGDIGEASERFSRAAAEISRYAQARIMMIEDVLSKVR